MLRILDVSAGHRAVWFNKQHPAATYLDIRPEVDPDVVGDSRKLDMFPDDSFGLAVFDPPHVNFGRNAEMSKTYGWHTTDEIRGIIHDTGKELSRVLTPDGLLSFKWNDHDQKLVKVLDLLTPFEPLFGHNVAMRTKHASMTAWVLLRNVK